VSQHFSIRISLFCSHNQFKNKLIIFVLTFQVESGERKKEGEVRKEGCKGIMTDSSGLGEQCIKGEILR